MILDVLIYQMEFEFSLNFHYTKNNIIFLMLIEAFSRLLYACFKKKQESRPQIFFFKFYFWKDFVHPTKRNVINDI